MSNAPPGVISPPLLEVSDLLALLWHSRRMATTLIVMGMVAAGAVASYMPKRYLAEASIEVETHASTATAPGRSGGSLRKVSTEIEVMLSRTTIDRVVDALALDMDIVFDTGTTSSLRLSKVRLPEALRERRLRLHVVDDQHYVLRSPEGDELLRGARGERATQGGIAITATWDGQLPRGASFTVTSTYRPAVVKQLRKRLKARELGRDSGIVALSFEDTQADQAVAILECVIATYTNERRQRMREAAKESLALIAERLPIARDELDRHGSELAQLESRHAPTDVAADHEALLSSLASVDSELRSLSLKKRELNLRLTASHPTQQAHDEQVALVENQQRTLRKALVEAVPIKGRLRRLEESMRETARSYADLMGQSRYLQIAAATDAQPARVIDMPAADIRRPLGPGKPLIMGGGAMLGLISALLLAIRRHITRPAASS